MKCRRLHLSGKGYPPLPSNSRTKKFDCTHGLERKSSRDLDPLPVTEATILAGCLFIVAGLGHCLPVPSIPEQLHVATMRDDMVDDRGSPQPQLTFHTIRTLTQRMFAQEYFARFLPSIPVAS